MESHSGYGIRDAQSGDLPALVAMREALQRHMLAETPGLFGLAPGWHGRRAEAYRSNIADPDARLVVATGSDDGLLGMGLVRIQHNPDLDPAQFGKFDDIWVEPRRRREGIGSAIVSALLAFLGERRIEDLVLDYATGNRAAERFWVGLGFQPVLILANARRERAAQLVRRQ